MKITVGARSSPLSRVQVEEVLSELRLHKDIKFEPYFLMTTGDIDLTTSLSDVTATDFFSKEIDELQLAGKIRVSIHSAKDLPEILPIGLKVICLTKGVDRRDALVLPIGMTIESLPLNPRIGSCSHRRQQAVEILRSDVRHVNIRGTIHQRLQLLEKGEVDAVVIAEAALIRLNLTSLNRIYLDAQPAHLQGQLAIVARADDDEMERLFHPLDTRKTVLTFGPESLAPRREIQWIHKPLFKIVEKNSFREELHSVHECQAIILTSKSAVTLLHKYQSFCPKLPLFCIGKATAQLAAFLFPGFPLMVANEEVQEGVISSIVTHTPRLHKLFWPHSSLSRATLVQTLEKAGIEVISCPAYDISSISTTEVIDFTGIEEILFTSPSTVEAFFRQSSIIPQHVAVSAIGPVTLRSLQEVLCSSPIPYPISPTISEIFNRQ